MKNRKSNIKQIWISDTTGRSLFGWKIKEEIFAIFFILVILVLANDENIVNKVSNNLYIQIFIGLIIIYCIYNRIPWSLAFVIILLISVLFSDFFTNVKGSVQKIFLDIKNKNQENIKDNNAPLVKLGAKVFGWLSNNKNKNQECENKKSILKKVKFDKKNNNEDVDSDSDSDDDKNNRKNGKSEHNNEVCEQVSKMFGFDDDIMSENETEPDTDGEESESVNENLKKNLKDSLKIFMKNNPNDKNMKL